MVKKTLLALATCVAVAIPATAFGQIGVAVKGGSLGVGGDVAIGLGKMLQLRGGYGSTLNKTFSGTFSDKSYTVTPPSGLWNVGVDLFPFGGGFHLSAGLMNRKQIDVTGDYTGSTQIGNTTYTGNIHVVGFMKNSSETGPYAGIGFGHTSAKGFGLTFDLGAGKLGDGTFTISSAHCTQSSGAACPVQPSQSDINAEQNKMNNDVGTFLKWHPIIQLGLKMGL